MNRLAECARRRQGRIGGRRMPGRSKPVLDLRADAADDLIDKGMDDSLFETAGVKTIIRNTACFLKTRPVPVLSSWSFSSRACGHFLEIFVGVGVSTKLFHHHSSRDFPILLLDVIASVFLEMKTGSTDRKWPEQPRRFRRRHRAGTNQHKSLEISVNQPRNGIINGSPHRPLLNA